MSNRIQRLTLTVEFGDCDPAQIVYFPNFFRWFDAGAGRYFRSCGVPTWRELEISDGIIGTPLVDTQARFVRPATYGDEIVVESTVTEWRGTSFVMHHRILRAGSEDLLCESTEVRVFAKRVEGQGTRIRAVAVPEAVKALCAVPSTPTEPGSGSEATS
jgi:4-hydroxybenzoyl-CoA thioesterase